MARPTSHLWRGLILCLALIAPKLYADLQVLPLRVVLTDQKKTTTLSLRHRGTKPGQYKISALFYRMKPDGNLELVPNPEPADRSVGKFLHFSPRIVTVPPNREQIVRVMLAAPKDLAEGEYRAHLNFEPTDESEQLPEAVTNQKNPISMQLVVKVSVGIPIIFRHGKTSLENTLSNLELIQNPGGAPSFSVEMTSKGNGFAFGEMFAFFTPTGKTPVPVGFVRNLSNYREQRTIKFPLNPPANVPLTQGTLRLEFREPEDVGGKTLCSIEKAIP